MGSGRLERIMVGLGASTGSCGFGVAVEASTTAIPIAAPMMSSSTPARRQNFFGAASNCAMVCWRCHQPAIPSSTSAADFASTVNPYGVATLASAPTRTHAFAIPETATATNAQAAVQEYRESTAQ